MEGLHPGGDIGGVARLRVALECSWGVKKIRGRNKTSGAVIFSNDMAAVGHFDGMDVIVVFGCHGGRQDALVPQSLKPDLMRVGP